MNRLRSESGSILLAAFAILALLVIILASLIAYGSWHKARCQSVLNRIKATYLAEAGIQRGLAAIDADMEARGSKQEVCGGVGTIGYQIHAWGGYLVIEGRGTSGRVADTLRAVVGQLAPSIFQDALSLIGPPYPLVVAGETRIDGDVMLSPAGVSRGELHGRVYAGDSLVYGRVCSIETDSAPQIDAGLLFEFLDTLKSLEENCGNVTDLSIVLRGESRFPVNEEEFRKTSSSILVDLSDSLQLRHLRYLFARREVSITGHSALSGVVLLSHTSITVDQDARLTDCILVSPVIIVTGNSNVGGQLVAEKSIEISGTASLTDMADVYLLGYRDEDELKGTVRLASRRESSAFLLYLGEAGSALRSSPQMKTTGRIVLEPGSSLSGAVWSNGYLELHGSLEGSAVANLLYYYDSPTLYLNWLVDARVRASNALQTAVLPLLLGQEKRLEFRKIGPES